MRRGKRRRQWEQRVIFQWKEHSEQHLAGGVQVNTSKASALDLDIKHPWPKE